MPPTRDKHLLIVLLMYLPGWELAHTGRGVDLICSPTTNQGGAECHRSEPPFPHHMHWPRGAHEHHQVPVPWQGNLRIRTLFSLARGLLSYSYLFILTMLIFRYSRYFMKKIRVQGFTIIIKYHHHHQKAFMNKSHTSNGQRPGLKRNKSKATLKVNYQ